MAIPAFDPDDWTWPSKFLEDKAREKGMLEPSAPGAAVERKKWLGFIPALW